jgi:DNA repair exonuclease SbcCD ATPase subunit
MEENRMRNPKFVTMVALSTVLLAAACSSPEPAREAARPTPSPAEEAAAELQRKRTEDSSRIEKRLAELDQRWSERRASLTKNASKSMEAVRAEVEEDIKNVRQAAADLKTTTPENWWERHEQVMERNVKDIEEDVRRFVKSPPPPAPKAPETPANAAPFESRRDRVAARLQARVDAMEERLAKVRARGAQQTELEDTRARVEKLKEDVQRLRDASADDWWDISAKRVGDYIDRVEASMGRLNDRGTGR